MSRCSFVSAHTLSLFFCCCLVSGWSTSCLEVTEHSSPETLSISSNPIISGTSTTSFPGSGALVLDSGYWSGFFCSGTLIDRNWVLTAAHCLIDVFDDGTELEPWMVSFFVGRNATTENGGAGGQTFEADAFRIHAQYNDETLLHDIALVHLRDAVPSSVASPASVPPEGVSPSVDARIEWVGYGANSTSGTTPSGGGIQRYGQGTVVNVSYFEYEYEDYGGTQPCYGDSGGSSYVTISGTRYISGVISHVVGASAGSDDCSSGGVDVRVDAYTEVWLEPTMDGEIVDPNCDILGGDCGSQACWYVSDTETSCWPSNHTAVGSSCEADPEEWGDNWPCVDGAYCYPVGPTADDGECTRLCENGTSCQSDEFCTPPIFEDEDIGICLFSCGVLDGDCGSDGACWPYSDEDGTCLASLGISVGSDCDPAAEETNPYQVQCGDGGICIQISDDTHDGSCYALCLEDTDCGTGDECYTIFTNVDVGVCVCIDDDNDRWCQSADCNDNNPNIHPDANEVCGDNVDNNCNDQTDEGCDCTDTDGDGFCPPADCAPDNGQIHPDANEVCGDSVDNNCNGFTDEGCDCTDIDGDGFCPPDDCDPNNGHINPNAQEACDDNVDNNCNGSIDEGCGCTDLDGDGFCPPDDCEDYDGGINPDMDELCGDGIDNDCNGFADEGCDCTDLDGDGFCPPDDCEDYDGGINPDMDEICGDGYDNNCNDYADEGCDCEDGDGDGFCPPDDCNDNNASLSPDATEVCNDDIDNDCNGVADGQDPWCTGEGGGGGSGGAACVGCSSARGEPAGKNPLLFLTLAGFLVVGVSCRRRR